MSYRRLDPKEIVRTAEVLSQRIGERFPKAGLRSVCTELNDTAKEAMAVAGAIKRPNWGFRLTVAGVSGAISIALFGILCQPNVRDDFGGISDYIQGIQALAQLFVYMGLIIAFLVSLELRRKRARVLRAIHDLRSLAHVVDMHQLDKDPERLLGPDSLDTESSPKRTMTVFELKRYLNYCSEMLGIISKIAAIYVQDFNDAISMDAAGDIEDLTTGLSRKIWQKITILERTPADQLSAE